MTAFPDLKVPEKSVSVRECVRSWHITPYMGLYGRYQEEFQKPAPCQGDRKLSSNKHRKDVLEGERGIRICALHSHNWSHLSLNAKQVFIQSGARKVLLCMSIGSYSLIPPVWGIPCSSIECSALSFLANPKIDIITYIWLNKKLERFQEKPNSFLGVYMGASHNTRRCNTWAV